MCAKSKCLYPTLTYPTLFSDKSWKWTDGSAVNYLEWAPGEPNDFDDTHLCVEMYTRSWPGLWNDHNCNEARPYICQAEKGDLHYFHYSAIHGILWSKG